MGIQPRYSVGGGALCLAAVAAAAVLVTSSSGASARTAASSGTVSLWSWPNADPYGTRDVASSINSSNVSKLKQAWAIPLKGVGTYGEGDTSPVYGANGMVYVQDVSMNVYAIDSRTGKVKWKHSVPKSQQGTIGPEGVTLVSGVIYGESKNTAFALSAATGEQLWESAVLGQKGSVAGFEMGPAISNGVEYLATPVQKNGGVVYALDVKTGKTLWKFHETQQPSSASNGGGALGNGGSWGSPVVADGSVFFGVANPYRTPIQAVQHPSKVLYNNSTVALNPRTGKLKWYMQAVPNDVYDWDMQIGPMYAASGPGGKPTVIDAGKMGYVYAMDASTGKLFWKTPVGKHNGHDNDGVLAMEHKLKLSTPYTVCPGDYGGVETQMALAGGVVYVPINNNCEKYTNVKKSSIAQANQPNPAKGTGEFEALSLSTGKVLWDTKLPSSAFGGATVTNDLVFTTLYNGKLIAFNRSIGKIVWNTQLSAGTNSSLSIDGDMLVTLASMPTGKGQKAEIVAYKL